MYTICPTHSVFANHGRQDVQVLHYTNPLKVGDTLTIHKFHQYPRNIRNSELGLLYD